MNMETTLYNLIDDEKWDLVTERLQSKDGQNEAQREEGKHGGFYPIQRACSKKFVPLNVIQTLFNAYPEGISKSNALSRQVPLHLAALAGTSVEVIDFLIDAYPIAVRLRDYNNRLPIHLAARNDSVRNVQTILNAYPEGVQERSKGGCLPIHHAAHMSKGVDVFQVLYEAYPLGIKVQTNIGELPIHYATYRWGSSPSATKIKFLIDKYPNGIQQCSRHGDLPIHLACANWASFSSTSNSKNKEIYEIFQILLDAYPESIILTRKASMTTIYESPIEIVKRQRHYSKELLSFLIDEEQQYFISIAQRALSQL